MTDIKAIRKAMRLSQEAFAELIGVNYTSVSTWERGLNQPTPETMAKIVALGEELKSVDPTEKRPYNAIRH